MHASGHLPGISKTLFASFVAVIGAIRCPRRRSARWDHSWVPCNGRGDLYSRRPREDYLAVSARPRATAGSCRRQILLVLSKSKSHPGGGVVEVQKDGKVIFEYKGTQSEVNTAQAIDSDRILISEAGDKPRLLEIDRSGRICVEIPLKAQTKDHHLQTRMARKLP